MHNYITFVHYSFRYESVTSFSYFLFSFANPDLLCCPLGAISVIVDDFAGIDAFVNYVAIFVDYWLWLFFLVFLVVEAVLFLRYKFEIRHQLCLVCGSAWTGRLRLLSGAELRVLGQVRDLLAMLSDHWHLPLSYLLLLTFLLIFLLLGFVDFVLDGLRAKSLHS